MTPTETEAGRLRFRFERKSGDRSTSETIESSLPFILEDDLARVTARFQSTWISRRSSREALS
jgi:hypothetical protein